MNWILFKAIYGTGHVPDKLLAASFSEDDLGVLLRVHLISEHFLQAFISAKIDKGDLYFGDTKDKEKFERGYFSKLNTAKEHGLPDPTYDALKMLNSARNDAVHQIESDSISVELVEKIGFSANSFTNHTDLDLTEHEMQTYDEYGRHVSRYKYNDSATPIRVNLLISFSCLLRRTLETVGLNPRHASSTISWGTFTQDGPAISSFSATIMDRSKPKN